MRFRSAVRTIVSPHFEHTDAVERGSLGEQTSSNLGHRLTLRVDGLDVVVVDAELHLGSNFVGIPQLEQKGD
jgi:hypothetical protein